MSDAIRLLFDPGFKSSSNCQSWSFYGPTVNLTPLNSRQPNANVAVDVATAAAVMASCRNVRKEDDGDDDDEDEDDDEEEEEEEEEEACKELVQCFACTQTPRSI